MNPSELKRFIDKIVKVNNCWEWLGHVMKNGYGQFSSNGKMVLSHRYSYELFIGEIPNGLQIDHLCRNRKCVNPYHLEVVTQQENIKRGECGKYQTKRTHCPQGHEYTKENTRLYKGRRYCISCNITRHKKRRYLLKTIIIHKYDNRFLSNT